MNACMSLRFEKPPEKIYVFFKELLVNHNIQVKLSRAKLKGLFNRVEKSFNGNFSGETFLDDDFFS